MRVVDWRMALRRGGGGKNPRSEMGYFKMALANLIPLLFKASSEGQDSEIALCHHAIWPRIVKCTRSINPLNRCKSNSEAWPRYPWMYEPHSCKNHVNHAWWVQKHASANMPQMLNWFILPAHFSNIVKSTQRLHIINCFDFSTCTDPSSNYLRGDRRQ